MKNLTTSIVSAICLATFITGCGGSSGGSTTTDTIAPTANTFTPANGSVNVETDTLVSTVFSEKMSAGTVNSSNFTLEKSNGTFVDAMVNYDATNDTVSLIPSSTLGLLTTYTALLNSNITDLTGNALTSTQWQFTTRDGSWQSAQAIEVDGGNAIFPQIAFDSSGNALAVWQQSDVTNRNIWSNRYTSGIGWGTAQKIESDDAGSAQYPQIAVDSSGNALAVWYQYDGTKYNIWSNRYTSGSGWGTAQKIESDDAGDARVPQIAFDSSGSALAVWRQFDGTLDNIISNSFK